MLEEDHVIMRVTEIRFRLLPATTTGDTPGTVGEGKSAPSSGAERPVHDHLLRRRSVRSVDTDRWKESAGWPGRQVGTVISSGGGVRLRLRLCEAEGAEGEYEVWGREHDSGPFVLRRRRSRREKMPSNGELVFSIVGHRSYFQDGKSSETWKSDVMSAALTHRHSGVCRIRSDR